MTDMSAVIIPKSDQLNAEDFIAGPRTYRIASVDVRAGQDQPVDIHLDGEKRVFRPCKSMSRVLVNAWGPDAKKYEGRSVTLYRDPTVKWGGQQVGGIRISHLSNIDRQMTMALTETKGKRAPFVVKPLADAPAHAEKPSTHPTATLSARSDKFEAALRGAHDLPSLTRIWSNGRDLRDELRGAMPDRAAELDRLHTMLDAELDPQQEEA